MTNQTSRTLTFAFAIVTVLMNTGRAQVRLPLPVAPAAPPVAPPIASPVAPPVKPIVPIGPIAPVTPPPPTPVFYLRSYLGKCLDFGPSQTSGVQVFISDCNNSAEQQVRIEEVNARHEVILHAGNKVIGYRPPAPVATLGGPSGPGSPVFALELQDQAGTGSKIFATVAFGGVTAANQTFALDGDSIILAANHTLVIQVQNARGANGSPLIVAARSLADSEFWDFRQIDHADIDPTIGFVRAGYPGSRVTAKDTLLSSLPAAAPGTVIEIYPGTDIDLTGVPQLNIPPGVTIRGSRRGSLLGPLLHKDSATDESIMLDIQGDNVRITGLRLQGTSSRTDQHQVQTWGVQAHDDQFADSIIDHNEIYDWTEDGVRARGSDQSSDSSCTVNASGICSQTQDPTTRLHKTFVIRNFIHHNRMEEAGYGVEAYDGGYPFVQGNTFVSNRHAIAAGHGTTNTGYRAWGNLVLSDAPIQHGLFYVQDFDMHGTGNDSLGVCCFGGLGGDYVDILGNTFLGTNRPNYALRAQPINFSDFRFNVSLRSPGDAVQVTLCAELLCNHLNDFPINVVGNQFQAADPTTSLGVGDFDGDGVQDLFLATGAAWYYSPHGTAEWRFLNPKIEKIDGFLFGDFDGDGRTDVVGMNGNKLMVSWGGASDWEYLNTVNAPITDLAVGKFGSHAVGDRRDDIFWADGSQWYVSSGGTGPFNVVNTSSFRVKDLRFGDFDRSGTTDVLGIISGKWMVSYSATSGWIPLPKSLTNTVDGLVVADFDGDGRADIATSTDLGVGWEWKFSSAGASDWTSRSSNSGLWWSTSLSSAAAIGSFDGNPGADVLLWGHWLGGDDKHLYIVSGGPLNGSAASPMYSRQDMR